MRRWHEERDLMLRRWRLEIAKHEYPTWGHYGLAPVPPREEEKGDCHCYRGPGFLRKHKPYDCGRARCGICHIPPKVYRADKKREKREALKRELIASEQWWRVD